MGVARDGGKLIKPWLIINSSRQLSPPGRRLLRLRQIIIIVVVVVSKCSFIGHVIATIHSLSQPVTHPPIHLFIHLVIHSFTHSSIHPSLRASFINVICFVSFFFGYGARHEQFGLWFAASVLLRLLFHPPPPSPYSSSEQIKANICRL